MDGQAATRASTDARFCAACGSPRGAPDDRFCGRCGAVFPPEVVQASGPTDPPKDAQDPAPTVHRDGAALAVAQVRSESFVPAEQLVLSADRPSDRTASPVPAVEYVVLQRPERLSWLVAGGTAAAAVGLALWAWVLLGQRDALIAQWSQRADELTAANVALQDELRQLGEERTGLLETRELLSRDQAELRVMRDRLSADRDQLTGDRDRLLAERDRLAVEQIALAGERDRLAAEKNDLAGQVAATKREKELTAEELAEAERREAQARREGERQQGRAQVAEQFNSALVHLLRLDDQIHGEYQTLVENVSKMYGATTRSSLDSYYGLVRRSGDRLSQLFRERETQIARLRS